MSIPWDPLEKEFDYQLFNSKKGLAPMLGWRLCYHTLRSKGSASGFPDRVLVRERVIFAELKRQKGVPTPAQVEWLNGLALAGAEVYLWRPSDLDEIAKILSTRPGMFDAIPSSRWMVPSADEPRRLSGRFDQPPQMRDTPSVPARATSE